PLSADYGYLFLDAVVLKVRDLAAKGRGRTVLVAYGVLPNGKREILDYQLAQGESETAWLEFLQALLLRGLEGQNLQLLVTDGGTGLRSEERRVGKECRSRWSADQEKENEKHGLSA